MQVDLPLIMTNGLFKNLHVLNEDQITSFLRYLVNFEAEKFMTSNKTVPAWWGNEVLYPHGFHRGRVPIPYTRNKLLKLQKIVKNCYAYHKCEDLLDLSDKLANLHMFEFRMIRNPDNTVTVCQKDSNSPMVVIPGSNLDYDFVGNNSTYGKMREVTIAPLKNSVVQYKVDTIELSDSDDEDNCVVIIGDSSSEDEVEIVSYQPPTKKLKPMLPKISSSFYHKLNCPLRKSPNVAFTSGLRHANDKRDNRIVGKQIPERREVPLPREIHPRREIPQRREILQRSDIPQRREIPQRVVDQNEIVGLRQNGSTLVTVDLLKSRLPHGNSSGSLKPSIALKIEPKSPPPTRRLLSLTRLNKPKDFIDLTYEDEEPVKQQQLNLQEAPKNDLLSMLNLVPKGSQVVKEPAKSTLPVKNAKKLLRISMQKIEICQVPRMISLGLLPKNCLCTDVELAKRMENIELCTQTYLAVHVDLKDPTAVARAVRRCSVSLTRLNSAGIRKWRRPHLAL